MILLSGGKQHSCEEIGRYVGLSGQRIGQIEAAAFDRIAKLLGLSSDGSELSKLLTP